MKYTVFCFLILSIILGSCNSIKQNGSRATELEGYNLVWSEEFDKGDVPDEEFWSHEEGFQRNNEMQWYQLDNAAVIDGLLVIEGRRERVKNTSFEATSKDWRKSREYAEYTSSSINTRGKFEFQYGIVEVKAKIDTASGMWPAIWTLGVSKPWPANGEIDIMEYYMVQGEATILANAAWAHPIKRAAWDEAKVPFADFLAKDPDWPSKFHIWKMDWTTEYIKIYLDGELLNEVDLSQTMNPDGFNPFHQPHYLLLNLALGSNGGSLENTRFPRKYQVDYVRVYQKKQ
ncbi:glycoside hydrolase family 16 protein [Algoriphagus sp. NG3]|uniref:glycoside hydrolase family 16 protein n=1 Tax=Algoriphagus sp. NG3 TaxID=3097546 RepID=UPI002A820251|nr:glycoside hydrolase family 16 protein [Algoriphagus sp. NG3]WPR77653.1 glycoside hydrolase family 16 protein [Algoriphagus sp. NG3]